ncbi:hypothetical protein Adt_41547 [Abeliophyllum distichum]|uniref:Uncharacterized protein n=1 Tax=Abeliophyllum distichum TaxID=126358 RepID=A0ABD1PP48_9LAMI
MASRPMVLIQLVARIKMAVAFTTRLTEGEDLFRVDPIRWPALDVPSIMVEEDLRLMRESYKIPSDIRLMLAEPNEKAYFSRSGCTALLLHAFTIYQLRKLPKKKGREEELGWYYFCPCGVHKPLVMECPSSVKQWKESWFWVTGNWQRVVDNPEPYLDVPYVYAEFEQGNHPRLTMARLASKKPRVLASGSFEDSKQKKVIEDLSRERNREEAEKIDVIKIDKGAEAAEGEVRLTRKRKVGASSQIKRKTAEVVDNYTVCSPLPLQRTLSVIAAGEVVLDIPPKVFQPSVISDRGPYDSKRKLRELIGPLGARILDDALWNLLFYPSMEAQAFKKYFSPRWEDLAFHGDLEDTLEASLATMVRTTGMHLKVLGEVRQHMQRHKKLVAKASNSKEHRQALEGLQAAKLDDANAAQKVTVKALEVVNEEKRRLQEETTSRRLEAKSLRGILDTSKISQKEAEAEITRLLGEKKEMERKLESVEAEYVANFHNTEAYNNFSNYFAKVVHQEVLAVLKSDYPELSLGYLESRFSPPDAEDEEDT